jgi:uncharacterized protein (DUF342 family)
MSYIRVNDSAAAERANHLIALYQSQLTAREEELAELTSELHELKMSLRMIRRNAAMSKASGAAKLKERDIKVAKVILKGPLGNSVLRIDHVTKSENGLVISVSR